MVFLCNGIISGVHTVCAARILYTSSFVMFLLCTRKEVNMARKEMELLCMLTDRMGRDTRKVWMTQQERADHIRNSPTDYYVVEPHQSRERG